MFTVQHEPKLKEQRGAIFVLTAVLGFMLLIVTALAVDFGTAYTQKEILQNAADAGALAGAGQLGTVTDVTSTSQTLPITNSFVKDYVNKNIHDAQVLTMNDTTDYPEASSEISIKATYEAPNTTTKTINVELRRRMPTYFLKIFGYDSIPVVVNAKAEYTKTTGSGGLFSDPSNAGNPFNYVLAAGSSSADSIFLESSNMYIKGNIRTNGKIAANNYAYNVNPATNELKPWASSRNKVEGSIYEDNQVLWNLHNEDKSAQTYLIADSSSTDTSRVSPNIIKSKTTIDVDLDLNKNSKVANTNTAVVREYIQSVINMSVKEREDNHIYYNDSGGDTGTYWDTITDSSGNIVSGLTNSNGHIYTVMISNGNITANPKGSATINGVTQTIILISINGNVTINNNGTFNCIAYAPRGTVRLSGQGELIGSFVGNLIDVTTDGQKITYGTGGGSTSTESISLIK